MAQDNITYNVGCCVAVYRAIEDGKIQFLQENPGRKRKRKDEHSYYFSSKRGYALLPLLDEVMYLLAVAVLFL